MGRTVRVYLDQNPFSRTGVRGRVVCHDVFSCLIDGHCRDTCNCLRVPIAPMPYRLDQVLRSHPECRPTSFSFVTTEEPVVFYLWEPDPRVWLEWYNQRFHDRGVPPPVLTPEEIRVLMAAQFEEELEEYL